MASQLPGGEYDLNDWTSKIDLSPLKATPNHVIQEVDGEQTNKHGMRSINKNRSAIGQRVDFNLL